MATELMRFALEKTMNKTDTKLLELAAKACHWNLEYDDDEELSYIVWGDDNVPMYDWNPLTDDGDALRLAVKLEIDIRFYTESEEAWVETAAYGGNADELLAPDPYTATRRAIVCAAAEIGRTM